MKDKLLIFGEVTAATKDTVAYAADILDMGKTTKTGNCDNVNVVIKAQTANNSADKVAVQLYDCATASGTYTLIAQGEPKCFGKDEVFAIPVPKVHKEFLKAGVLPTSTGTFTSTKYDVSIQIGY